MTPFEVFEAFNVETPPGMVEEMLTHNWSDEEDVSDLDTKGKQFYCLECHVYITIYLQVYNDFKGPLGKTCKQMVMEQAIG